MVAKGGARLLQDAASSALKECLTPKASVITPNIPEAEDITGRKISDLAGMEKAADDLLALGARAVVIKGGHLGLETVYNVLATPTSTTKFEYERLDTIHTHGTGCTFSSALAVRLSAGCDLETATRQAGDFVHDAIRVCARGLGGGHGPLGHLNRTGLELFRKARARERPA